MKDTSPEIESAVAGLFAARSGSDRIEMMSEMFDDAKALMASDIRFREPGISPSELRVRIFERLYFDDFSPRERERITALLRT
jgi:hypothetical protein